MGHLFYPTLAAILKLETFVLSVFIMKLIHSVVLNHFVGNKAKGRISKRVFREKQSNSNFLKNEHFLPPDMHLA